MTSPQIPSFARLGPPGNVSSLSIKKSNSYDVTASIRRVKHGTQEALPGIFLQFASYDAARSFQVEYTIRAANLPDSAEGVMNVVVEKA